MYRDVGVLVCDDSSEDALFLERAFRKAGINARLDAVTSGESALDYLLGRGTFTERKVPMLVILDVKMPGMDGFDVLAWVRGHPDLRKLPVLMLSSSGRDEDVDRAHELGCNAYAVKPHRLEDLVGLVGSIEEFWFKRNRYPTCCGRIGELG